MYAEGSVDGGRQKGVRVAALLRGGELCSVCVQGCVDDDGGVAIACSKCSQAGCDDCDHRGYWIVKGCPREFVSRRVIDAINVATLCKDGVMPEPGGLFDQSSYFVELMHFLNSEEARLENERLERRYGK